MELLLSSPLTIPSTSSSSRKNLMQKHPFLSDQTSLTFSTIKRYPDARKLEFPRFRAQASESVQASRQPDSGTEDAVNQEIHSKDEHLVFVAGATGKVGSRTVRELLKLGFRVRAGVRSAQRAQTLVQSVQQLKLDDGASAVEKLEIVECDLERDRIEPAIANASVVICCIGASEKEIFDITGPYRIDYQATKNLIDAASVAGVYHFILLTSLGTNKIGFPAAILNLFWGVLIWKRKAEEALIASGLPYTIVRPGGMERPTDTYKETHNISLAKEDTLFGGQVSNLQVAELMAFMIKNRDLSYYKVVEVIAETTAPLSSFGDLLSKLPSQRVDSSLLKEPQTARKTVAAPPQSSVPVATSSVVEKEPAKNKGSTVQPSSYILYEDLKPPSSPTPSTTQAPTRDVNVQEIKVKPVLSDTQDSSMELTKSASAKEFISKDIQNSGTLLPYAAYDDLKPPTSPTPGAPRTVSPLSLSTTDAASKLSPKPDTSVAQDTKSEEVEDKEHFSRSKPRPLSPFTMYEDLKPPSSPSPGAPQTVSPLSSSTTDAQFSPKPDTSIAEAATSDKLEDKRHFSESKPRPLSPFTMYEDLKPPSSPVPSLKKC